MRHKITVRPGVDYVQEARVDEKTGAIVVIDFYLRFILSIK
jgi:hypothetical protein